MKVHPMKPLLLAAMIAAILPLATALAQQQKSAPRVVATNLHVPSVSENSASGGAKRVWTNDDFPSREPAVPFNTTEPAPAAAQDNPETAAKRPTENSGEFQQAQKEVLEEMLATARNRQKAYEDTIGIIEGRLLTETGEFRIEVYKKILEDTRGLQKINEQMLQRFEGLSGNGEQKPEAPQQ